MKSVFTTSALIATSFLAAFVAADGCGSDPAYPDGNPNKYVLRKEGSPCKETTGACSCNGDDILECVKGFWVKTESCIGQNNLICVTNKGSQSCVLRQ